MTAAKIPPRLYTCAYCGKRARVESMVYSSHTGNRFCVDPAACERRRKRGGRA